MKLLNTGVYMSNPIKMVAEMYPWVPFQKLLGIKIKNYDDDYAEISIPFREELAGTPNVYHGGVIASLIDLTGALSAWSGHDDTKGMRASTVSLNVQYLSGAKGEDIVAKSRAVKRGKELVFCAIEVFSVTSNRLIAKGDIVYRIV